MGIAWQSLRVGDMITFHDLPDERLHEETTAVYKWLIESRTPIRVVRIDGDGYPWAEFCRTIDNVEEFHSLMINHAGIEAVIDGNS